MKKLALCITFLVLTLSMIACDKKVANIEPETPGVVEPDIEQPIIETPDTELPTDNEEPITETPIDDIPETDPSDVDHSKTIILDNELRNKGVSYNLVLDTINNDIFKLEMYMTGTYDNPITVKAIKIDDVMLDLDNIEGLPKKASDIFTGQFMFNDIVVSANRVTNYQGLRIKSTSSEVGYIQIDITNINKLEVELVFTTSAAQYFEKVVVTLK